MTLRTVIVIALLCLLSVSARGQAKSVLDKTIFVDYGERFHADAYVVPTDHPDTARIAVFFRMANDFLSFEKVTDASDIGGNFKAPMSVGIELRDTMGVIRQRERWEGMAYTNTFDETNSKNKFHFGWIVFSVTGGTYDIALEILEQKESNEKRITVPSVSYVPNKPLRQLTAPLFVEPNFIDGKELLRPYVFGGNVSFGSKDAVALILLSDDEPVEYDYQINQLPYGLRDIQWWTVSNVLGSVRSSTTRFPRMSSEATTSQPFLEIADEEVSARPIALVEVPVPVTNFVPGNYELLLIRKGTTDTIAMKFRIVWEMMPLSLRNIDYAFALMKYIMPPDVLDDLDDGSDIERRQNLMRWWREQDRTLTTTFNERQAEYFHRVDQAFFAFSTIQEPDGADTERGKVYVLYGAPTEISKELPVDGEPQEVWYYKNKVNKVIRFVIDDAGLFKLKTVEPFIAPANAGSTSN